MKIYTLFIKILFQGEVVDNLNLSCLASSVDHAVRLLRYQIDALCKIMRSNLYELEYNINDLFTSNCD